LTERKRRPCSTGSRVSARTGRNGRDGCRGGAGGRGVCTAPSSHGLVDFDDLILLPLRLLDDIQTGRRLPRALPVGVGDEYQDMDESSTGSSVCSFRRTAIFAAIRPIRIRPSTGSGARTRGCSSDSRTTTQGAHGAPHEELSSGRSIVAASMQVIEPATLVGAGRWRRWPRTRRRSSSATRRATGPRPIRRPHDRAVDRRAQRSSPGTADGWRMNRISRIRSPISPCSIGWKRKPMRSARRWAVSGMPYQRRSHGRLIESPGARALAEAMAANAVRAGICPRGWTPPRRASRTNRFDSMRSAYSRWSRIWPAAAIAWRRSCPSWPWHRMRICGTRAPTPFRCSLCTPRKDSNSGGVIVGCEDGILPFRWGGKADTDAGADEERRLLLRRA